jgi:hypothetical protein
MFFYKKNYKAKFSTSSILKKKTQKEPFKKKSYKERKKNHTGKHYNNPQCFYF